MRLTRRGSARGLRATLAIAALMAASACGSSSQTSVQPSTVRCAVQAHADTTSFPAEGGAGTLQVSVNRECAWSVESNAAWIGIPAQASGQGEGSMKFTVAPNEDPASRAAPLRINDQQMQVSQVGRPCVFRLSSTYEMVDASGGARTVRVEASSAQCNWSATANVPWITVRQGASGQGTGAVLFEVAAEPGPVRTGTLTVAGQSVTIEQGTGCTYATGVTTLNVSALGGRAEVPVQAPPGCTWTAATDASWITIAGNQTGTGSGAVVLQVAAGPGPTRTGTVTVAGLSVRIVQGSGCTFATGVTTVNVSAAGGRAEVPVLAPPDCAWAAAVDVPWIALVAGQTGSGGGTVVLEVAASAGASRTGTVAVGGVNVTIVQGSHCTYAAGVPSISASAAGGLFEVPMTAPAGCAWTAVSQASWIDVTSGASGSGPGVVRVSVRASDGPARSGTLSVAGTNLLVTQASGCRFDVSPLAYDALAGGGTSSTSVQAGAGCAWAAASNAPWISLSRTSGTGSAPVPFSVAPNDGPQRSGTVTVAGHTISIRQPSRCTWTLSPPSVDYDGNGGRASVLVIVVGGCTWTTESTVSWITLETGAAGTGDGLVQFIVDPNPGGSRSGVVRIAGIDLVVRQTPR